MPRRPAALLPLLLAAVPATALADEPAGYAEPVSAVPAYAVPPPTYVAPPSYAAPGVVPVAVAVPAADAGEPVGVDRRVRQDRLAERGYLMPTALVAPGGTTTFTMQAPVAPGASFRLDRSFSDRLSLGVGVIGMIDDDELVGIGNLHGKYQLWRGRRAALAVTASMYNLPGDADIADGEDQDLFVPGVTASFCTTDECRTLLSFDVQALAGVSDEVLPIVGGVSLASGGKTQLIAELHTTTADDERLLVGFLGGRFLGRRWALDAGIGFAAIRQHTRFADCIDFCGDVPESQTEIEGAPYPFFALSKRL